MKMLENWRAKAVFFVQNNMYLFLDEVLCIYCATHSVSFLVLPFVQLKCKAKWLPDIFFNGDHLAKVVPPGTPFLRPVQYDRTFLGPVQYDRRFHGKHSKLLNMDKHSIFSAMQSERDNFLGI